MSEKQEFNEILARGNTEELRVWWEKRYSPSSFALFRCAISVMGKKEEWTPLIIESGGGTRYLGRVKKDASKVEIRHRGADYIFNL